MMVRLRLEELLRQHGRTLYWLAKQTGISHTTLWRYRHQETEGIRWTHLESICRALECKPADLFELVDDAGRGKIRGSKATGSSGAIESPKGNLITVVEAGERLGIHRTRVNILIKEGRLPATRYGRAYLIEEKDLELVKDRPPGRPSSQGQSPARKRRAPSGSGQKKR
ncbi:MAG TPA: helix-turn-helix domain-containing protein [Blastocatellia bacterium]|nr:helix-turn-helix domain-containing protein [Blastocatellia bacterium]